VHSQLDGEDVTYRCVTMQPEVAYRLTQAQHSEAPISIPMPQPWE